MPEFRAAMVCRGNFLSTFVATSETIIAGGLQVGNRAKECQLNQAKPLVVKDKSYKLSKNQW